MVNRKSRRREDYPYILDYRLRWNDNDMYDHMNNSVYNFLFDSAANDYTAEHCNIYPPTSPVHPMVVHVGTDFYASIAYPSVAEVGVRVAKLGKTSVHFEMAVFEKGKDGVCAVCDFVQVFVDRATLRPCADGLPRDLKDGLEKIHNSVNKL